MRADAGYGSTRFRLNLECEINLAAQTIRFLFLVNLTSLTRIRRQIRRSKTACIKALQSSYCTVERP